MNCEMVVKHVLEKYGGKCQKKHLKDLNLVSFRVGPVRGWERGLFAPSLPAVALWYEILYIILKIIHMTLWSLSNRNLSLLLFPAAFLASPTPEMVISL